MRTLEIPLMVSAFRTKKIMEKARFAKRSVSSSAVQRDLFPVPNSIISQVVLCQPRVKINARNGSKHFGYNKRQKSMHVNALNPERFLLYIGYSIKEEYLGNEGAM